MSQVIHIRDLFLTDITCLCCFSPLQTGAVLNFLLIVLYSNLASSSFLWFIEVVFICECHICTGICWYNTQFMDNQKLFKEITFLCSYMMKLFSERDYFMSAWINSLRSRWDSLFRYALPQFRWKSNKDNYLWSSWNLFVLS